MRIIHYVNQFFGGLGGEDVAHTAPQVQDGAVGPGRLLQQLLGDNSQIVRTIVTGDNFAAENQEELIQLAVQEVKDSQADIFIAGPCFAAGRYGVAAGALCTAIQAQVGIPVITAMTVENPGVDLYRQELYIVDSGANASEMQLVLSNMVALLIKLANNEEIGRPESEGYIPRGILQDGFEETTAAARMLEMLYAKTTGSPFRSEFTPTSFPTVPAPLPVGDLSKARIAIVTDGGLVPAGNPDNISHTAATTWGSYDISGLGDLNSDDYEVAHRGYDTRYVEQDPHRMVPIDALRELENEGVVGKVHEEFYSTSGLANPLANSRRLGREIAQKLKDEGVDAVVLTSA